MTQPIPSVPKNRSKRWTHLWLPLLRLSVVVGVALSPFVFAARGLVPGISHAEAPASAAQQEKERQALQEWEDRGGFRFLLEKFSRATDPQRREVAQKVFGLSPNQYALIRKKDPAFPDVHNVHIELSPMADHPALYINVDREYYDRIILQEKLHLSPNLDPSPYGEWYNALPLWKQRSLRDAAAAILAERGAAFYARFTDMQGGGSLLEMGRSGAQGSAVLQEIMICQKDGKHLSLPSEEGIVQRALRTGQTDFQRNAQTGGGAGGTGEDASGTGTGSGGPASGATAGQELPADIKAWLIALSQQTPPFVPDPKQVALYQQLLDFLQTFSPEQRQQYFSQILPTTKDLTTLLQKLGRAKETDAFNQTLEIPQARTDDQALADDIDKTWQATAGDWKVFRRLPPAQQQRLLLVFQQSASTKHLKHLATHPLKLLEGMKPEEVEQAIERAYQAAKNPNLSTSERLGAAFQGHALRAGKFTVFLMGVGTVLVVATVIFVSPAAALAGVVVVGKIALTGMVTSLLCSGASVVAYQQACLNAKTEQEAKRTCSTAAQESAGLTANLALMGLVESVGTLVKLPPVKTALVRARQKLTLVNDAHAYQAWLKAEPDFIVKTYQDNVRGFLAEGPSHLPKEHALLMGITSGQELVDQLTSPQAPLSLLEKLSAQQLTDLRRLPTQPGMRAVLDTTWTRARAQLARLPEMRATLAQGVVREVEKEVAALRQAGSKEEAGRILDRLAGFDDEKRAQVLKTSMASQLKTELLAEQAKQAAEPVLAATGTDGPIAVQTVSPQAGKGTGAAAGTTMSTNKPGGSSPAGPSRPGTVEPAQGSTAAPGAREIPPGSQGPALGPENTRTPATPAPTQTLPAGLASARDGLRAPEAQAQFDFKVKAVTGNKGWTAETQQRMEAYVERVRRGANGDLEAGLQAEYEKAHPQPKAAYGPALAALPGEIAYAQKMLEHLRGQQTLSPIKGMRRIIERVEAEAGVLQNLANGKKEVIVERLEGARANIDSAGSEAWRARRGTNVVEVSRDMTTIEGKTIDIDLVEHGGARWVENKNKKPFTKGSGEWPILEDQVHRLKKEAAQPGNYVDGKPPQIVVCFTQGAVAPDVAAALQSMGVEVEVLQYPGLVP